MSMNNIVGNLLNSDCDYICHQVNCMGKMGSGIAKQIRIKWPEVYIAYIAKCKFLNEDQRNYIRPELNLGAIQIVPTKENSNKFIINMFSQLDYGYDGKRYTSYDSFWMCLGRIKQEVPKGKKIGFPKGIGCGLGGANWSIIETMIRVALSDDYQINIYELE